MRREPPSPSPAPRRPRARWAAPATQQPTHPPRRSPRQAPRALHPPSTHPGDAPCASRRAACASRMHSLRLPERPLRLPGTPRVHPTCSGCTPPMCSVRIRHVGVAIPHLHAAPPGAPWTVPCLQRREGALLPRRIPFLGRRWVLAHASQAPSALRVAEFSVVRVSEALTLDTRGGKTALGYTGVSLRSSKGQALTVEEPPLAHRKAPLRRSQGEPASVAPSGVDPRRRHTARRSATRSLERDQNISILSADLPAGLTKQHQSNTSCQLIQVSL